MDKNKKSNNSIISAFTYFTIGILLLFIGSCLQSIYNQYDANNHLISLFQPSSSHSTTSNLQHQALINSIVYSKEVKHALDHNLPIVSLESTIISHGMPYPQNYETALKVESIIRSHGVTPATIAIINGKIHVGLESQHLHHLAVVGKDAMKTSRRDLAMVLSNHTQTGSTTVSSTILISNLVGIKVFVTGGLGGVHRGAETTMDVSADLIELSRNDVTVVCAGVKSILDIGKTLEYLETHGVTVITYQSNMFPSFFTPSSSFKSPFRMDSIDDIASAINTNHMLNLESGIVVAIPNNYQMVDPNTRNNVDIDGAINDALKEAEQKNIVGKDITPFLLKRVNEITVGESLKSNIHLVINNAIIGSQIALALNKLKYGGVPQQQLQQEQQHRNNQQYELSPEKIDQDYKVTVIGGAVIDMISHSKSDFQLGTSNPGSIRYCMGGVGRNIAETLARLKVNPLFLSLVGDDMQSTLLLNNFKSLNISTRGISQQSGHTTATYNAIMNKGDLVVAIAIMNIFDNITPAYVEKFENDIIKSKIIVFDGNIPTETMITIVDIAKQHRIPVFFEPTSVVKSTKPILTPENIDILPDIKYISPNTDEALKMANTICEKRKRMHTLDSKFSTVCEKVLNSGLKENQIHSTESITNYAKVLLYSGIQTIFLKAGPSGVYLIEKSRNGGSDNDDIVLKHYPSIVDSKQIVDATGAGDSMVGGIIWSFVQDNESKSKSNGPISSNVDLDKAIKYGNLCSKATLQSSNPVSSHISIEYLNNQKN